MPPKVTDHDILDDALRGTNPSKEFDRTEAQARPLSDGEKQVSHDSEASQNLAVALPQSEGTELSQWQKEFVDIFRELDRNGSGSLSAQELRAALEVAGVPRARMAKLLKLADSDNSGEIELEEWVRVVTNTHNAEMKNFSVSLWKRRSDYGSIFFEEPSNHCNRCMVNPKSYVRMSWDAAMSVLVMYICLALPFTIAWENLMSSQTSDRIRLADQIINYLFILDIFLNLRTGYFDRDNDLVMEGKRVLRHYLKTWFFLDVLSCFPFEEFENELGHVSDAGISPTRALKVTKLFKLLRIVRMMRPRHVNVEDFSVVIEDLAQSTLYRVLSRRSAVFTYTLLLCHWLACGMKMVDQGWLSSYDDVGGHMWSEYLSAVYWAMTTLTTVGYGDITPSSDGERAFVTVSMVVGGAFYGYVVGAITSLVQNSDINLSAYYDRMDHLQAWMFHHRLPTDVKRTIRRYFKNFFVDKSAINDTEIWSGLSPELQREVAHHIVHEDVKNNPLFDGLSAGSIVHLQAILQRVTVLPGREVVKGGEVGIAMYIIVSGWLSKSQSGKREENLGPGESFGEEVLLGFMENYEYTATVLERAKLDMILESEFVKVFQTMPNELERMRQNTLEFNPQWCKILLQH